MSEPINPYVVLEGVYLDEPGALAGPYNEHGWFPDIEKARARCAELRALNPTQVGTEGGYTVESPVYFVMVWPAQGLPT